MSEKQSDMRDDEIRIISSGSVTRPPRRRRTLYIALAVIFAIAAAGVTAWLLSDDAEPDEVTIPAPQPLETATPAAPSTPAYTVRTDTVVNGVPLSIYTPCNATPLLVIGEAALSDTSAVLVAQAADVRGDNGQIAGAYVVRGELVSKGQAKAGFCSIINGDITVGVADATPMLEEALATEGYFFRQYPLVVAGQLVENKPKGRALRKALAEINGRIHVISSPGRLTFHDFSRALVDLGARNAIYLVGASSSGFYVDAQGLRTDFTTHAPSPYENINFIVWR